MKKLASVPSLRRALSFVRFALVVYGGAALLALSAAKFGHLWQGWQAFFR
jgi:hypothetical protein